MKKVLVLITLKLAEVFGFISICVAFARLGRIYFSLMGVGPSCDSAFLQGYLECLWGIAMTLLAIAVPALIIGTVIWVVKENWKLVRSRRI